MKVLFLDFDGILRRNNSKCKRDVFGNLFDEDCIEWLEYIVHETGCKIVVSSSWRSKGLIWLKDLFKYRGIDADILDCIPYLNKDLKSNFNRTDEIHRWLENTEYDIVCYVIVDDNIIHDDSFIHIDGCTGLNSEYSEKIIKIMNNKFA